MSVHLAETHLKDPMYQSALHHLQKGEWENGIVALDKLILRYPLEHTLRTFRQEMHLRARMESDEQVDQSLQRRRHLTKLGSRLWVALMVVALVFTGYRGISSFVQDKVEVAREAIEREFFFIEQAAMFRDAEALLRADRPDEALALLKTIQESEADFPELEPLLAEAQLASKLDSQYLEAKRMMEDQDWLAAQLTMGQIMDQDPTFRDVAILLDDLERYSIISEIFSTTEQYFVTEAWVEAVDGYESVRALDAEFQASIIEDRLFTSYVNAAQSFLVDQADSLQALDSAERNFRKALALRPQNPEVKVERELAYLYLKAQNDFNQGLWSGVINGLEIVNAEKPDYALGTARQTLYEAYIARGDNWMAKSEFELATDDYQRATVLAEQDPEAVLRLFEAHLKIAEVEGALGNFESAVVHYRAAVEITDLKTRALRDSPAQAFALTEAENSSEDGKFSLAYEEYRKALGIVPGNICLSFGAFQESQQLALARERMITHIVQSDEYLTMLANRYRSTVCAIVVANELDDPDVIYVGQELLIPVLP